MTDIVAAASGGDYTVANLQTVEVQGSYGGWSLVVATRDETAPRRQLVVTSPFTWFSPEHEFSASVPVPPLVDGVAQLDVLAYEGEPGFLPESLLVDGEVLGGDNAFDGTISTPRNPQLANSFGMDIDAYDLRIDAPDGSLTFEARSEKDGVRLAVFALAVDLEP